MPFDPNSLQINQSTEMLDVLKNIPRSIRWDVNTLTLTIIDQTKLPTELVEKPLPTIMSVWDSIKRLEVRGAPAIGIAAAYGLLVGLKDKQQLNNVNFVMEVERQAAYLNSARPTAVNLSWALKRMVNTAMLLKQKESNYIFQALLKVANLIHEEDRQICRHIGYNGLPLIKPGIGILTHCNAGSLAVSEFGTATAPLYMAHAQGIKFRVYADETRPLLQGARLTAWELQRAGIDVTLICDNMAATLMAQGVIDMVIVGTDRVTANGEVINKIGTLGVAVLAKHFNIPFYVACPSSTLDLACHDSKTITIEEREATEVTHFGLKRTAPAHIKTRNPAFDITPPELVTGGIITERGVIHAPYRENLQLFEQNRLMAQQPVKENRQQIVTLDLAVDEQDKSHYLLADFVRISQYAGRRFDLTQANGGNSSVKIKDEILLKSTGFYLSDVSVNSGFSRVLLQPMQAIYNTQHPDLTKIAAVVKNNLKSGNAPSIEIGMHVLLGKFVLHTHPLAVNVLTCRKDWQQILAKLFPQALLVKYATPGTDLSIQVLDTLQARQVEITKPIIMFLQNHGLVVSANDADLVMQITEEVVNTIEKQQQLDFSKYKVAAQICNLIERRTPQYGFCYCSTDQELHNILQQDKTLFFKDHCIPAAVVYNTRALEIKNLTDMAEFQAYVQTYNRTPCVIIYQNQIYIVAKNIQKAQELESVLKEHILLHNIVKANIRPLTSLELQALSAPAPVTSLFSTQENLQLFERSKIVAQPLTKGNIMQIAVCNEKENSQYLKARL